MNNTRGELILKSVIRLLLSSICITFLSVDVNAFDLKAFNDLQLNSIRSLKDLSKHNTQIRIRTSAELQNLMSRKQNASRSHLEQVVLLLHLDTLRQVALNLGNPQSPTDSWQKFARLYLKNPNNNYRWPNEMVLLFAKLRDSSSLAAWRDFLINYFKRLPPLSTVHPSYRGITAARCEVFFSWGLFNDAMACFEQLERDNEMRLKIWPNMADNIPKIDPIIVGPLLTTYIYEKRLDKLAEFQKRTSSGSLNIFENSDLIAAQIELIKQQYAKAIELFERTINSVSKNEGQLGLVLKYNLTSYQVLSYIRAKDLANAEKKMATVDPEKINEENIVSHHLYSYALSTIKLLRVDYSAALNILNEHSEKFKDPRIFQTIINSAVKCILSRQLKLSLQKCVTDNKTYTAQFANLKNKGWLVAHALDLINYSLKPKLNSQDIQKLNSISQDLKRRNNAESLILAAELLLSKK